MSNHPIEGLMLTAMNSIEDMIDVNTIIGEPIETNNGIVIIPISKSSMSISAKRIQIIADIRLIWDPSFVLIQTAMKSL